VPFLSIPVPFLSIPVDSSAIPADSSAIPVDSGAIPVDSGGMTPFLQESVGHGEVLQLEWGNLVFLASVKVIHEL
jgi:hypothetical protein